MKSKLIAGLLIAASAAFAAPAFASGFGPAPFYRPDAGAPSSQSGLSARTLAAEQNGVATSDVGGAAVAVQSGSSRSVIAPVQSSVDDLYRGR